MHRPQLNPSHTKALYNRAVALERLRRHEAAAADYSAVLQMDPQNAPAWQNRGALWLRLGRLQEAVQDLGRAVALDGGAAAAWHARGEAYERLGQGEAALADLQRWAPGGVLLAAVIQGRWEEGGRLSMRPLASVSK